MSIKDSKKSILLVVHKKTGAIAKFQIRVLQSWPDRPRVLYLKTLQRWPDLMCGTHTAKQLSVCLCYVGPGYVYRVCFGEQQILQISRWKLYHMNWLHLSISCHWNIFLIFTNCSKTLFTCRVGNLSNSWQEQQSRLGLFCTSTRRGVDQGHVWNQFHKVWFINIHLAPCIKSILGAFCPQSEVVTYCTLPESSVQAEVVWGSNLQYIWLQLAQPKLCWPFAAYLWPPLHPQVSFSKSLFYFLKMPERTPRPTFEETNQ